MREKLRYALIGCGRIAPNHIAAYMNNAEDLELCAVCDPVPERMEAVLRPLPEEERTRVRRYTDHRELLAREAPQLCAVATESGLHAQVGLDVLRAGSNVIIEKPLALSLADARALIDEADARGLKLCACHQNRFNKSIQKIRTAVEEERFGRMLHGTVHVRWNRGEEYYRQAPWRGTWAMDGGALMNQCIHSIDLLRWMLGDGVTEVMAYTDNLNHPYIQAEDLGLALVRFDSGAYGVVEGTTNVYPSQPGGNPLPLRRERHRQGRRQERQHHRGVGFPRRPRRPRHHQDAVWREPAQRVRLRPYAPVRRRDRRHPRGPRALCGRPGRHARAGAGAGHLSVGGGAPAGAPAP